MLLEVKSVVCDYGIYENGELKLILNDRENALLITKILEADNKKEIYKEVGNLNIEYGSITDEEIDQFGEFSDYEKKIIKNQYSRNKKGTFPNPRCALY